MWISAISSHWPLICPLRPDERIAALAYHLTPFRRLDGNVGPPQTGSRPVPTRARGGEGSGNSHVHKGVTSVTWPRSWPTPCGWWLMTARGRELALIETQAGTTATATLLSGMQAQSLEGLTGGSHWHAGSRVSLSPLSLPLCVCWTGGAVWGARGRGEPGDGHTGASHVRPQTQCPCWIPGVSGGAP